MADCLQSNFTLAGIIRKKVIIVIARATPKKKIDDATIQNE